LGCRETASGVSLREFFWWLWFGVVDEKREEPH